MCMGLPFLLSFLEFFFSGVVLCNIRRATSNVYGSVKRQCPVPLLPHTHPLQGTKNKKSQHLVPQKNKTKVSFQVPVYTPPYTCCSRHVVPEC